MGIDTPTRTLPDSSADERATRLADASSAWDDRIAADRSAPHLRYGVHGTWEGAVATRVRAGAHTFWIDEPAALAGDDVAASPVEIALDAARLFGADETVRAGFSAIRLDIRIDGPESSERYEQLRDAVDAHCPVLDLFANPTPVTATVAKR